MNLHNYGTSSAQTLCKHVISRNAVAINDNTVKSSTLQPAMCYTYSCLLFRCFNTLQAQRLESKPDAIYIIYIFDAICRMPPKPNNSCQNSNTL